MVTGWVMSGTLMQLQALDSLAGSYEVVIRGEG